MSKRLTAKNTKYVFKNLACHCGDVNEYNELFIQHLYNLWWKWNVVKRSLADVQILKQFN